jgi:outer membrane protein
LTLPASALAVKIGYVDARRLIDESPQGQVELKKLEDEFAERNRDIKGRIDLFAAKEAELQKNAVLMSPEEIEEATEELRNMQRDLRRDQRDYNEEYNARRNRSLAGLQKIISDAVISIAKKDEYDLIVQQAVYASDSINLTDSVLKELARRAEE